MLQTLLTLTALALTQQTDSEIAVRAGTRLEVSNVSGVIVVKAWSKSAVRIHAEHSRPDAFDVTLEASVLTVKASSRRGPPETVDFTINAPTWMTLTLSGVSSDIDVDGTQAAVTAETVSGEIKCRGGSGYVSLQSVAGAIDLQDAKGRIDVHSVSDDVTLTDLSGDITAETVSGNLTLEGIEAGNVDVSTVSGDVEYDGALKDAGRYRFAAHNGDLTIAVPEKTNATVSVATFNGDFDSSFPVSVTATTRRRFSFTIGSGSARIELETFNGDIKLRRPGELDDEDRGGHHHHPRVHRHDQDEDQDN